LSYSPLHFKTTTRGPIKINRRGSIAKNEFDPSNEILTNPHLTHGKKKKPSRNFIVCLKKIQLEEDRRLPRSLRPM
jgi:hypothetical protein